MIATDPRDTMRAALEGVCNACEVELPPEVLAALTDAACAAYGRHQTGEAYGLPPYEPPTCGTQHLLAERVLRLLDKGTPFDALPDGNAITAVVDLVHEAGVHFAREWLARNAADERQAIKDEDLPF